MTSRVLGVARESILASLFGASDAMDAYRFAFRIPNLLRDLFAEGAMSAAFVPTFTARLKAEGKGSALRLGNNVTNALLVFSLAAVAVGVLAAPLLVDTFAPSYAAVPGKRDLTILLTRILMPFLTCVALAAAAAGMLNTLHHFFLPALAPAVFNVVSIAVLLGLYVLFPHIGIAVVAIGAVAGALMQWLMQLPLLRREAYTYRPAVDWRDPGLRQVLTLLVPGTIGVAATQINLLVNTQLATYQGTSVLSWIDYAFRVMYLPIGLFGVSIATATLPAVSRQASERDLAGVRTTVANSLSLMMMLNIPATVGLVVLATPIVRLLYERHRFTPADTVHTAAALQLYAIGLVGYSVSRIVSPVFYAIGANRTPVIVSVCTVLLNLVLSLTLVDVIGQRWNGFGYLGLPLATSLAALFNCLALLFLLRDRLDGLGGRRLASSIVRIVLAAAVMGLVASWVDSVLASHISGRSFPIDVMALAATIGSALAALALAAYLLRIREFAQAARLLSRRLRRFQR